MNLLLDTHVLLWWMADDPELPPAVRSAISSQDNMVHISAATIWEIGIKKELGKLTIPDDWFPAICAEPFGQISISGAHAVEASALPNLHRDPFDRMLVAQARLENLVLVTTDPQIKRYDVNTLPWQ